VGTNRVQLEAVARYVANPNRCGWCEAPILHRPGTRLHDTKHRKFCGQSCATQSNNRARGVQLPICRECGQLFPRTRSGRVFCPPCFRVFQNRLADRPKAQVTTRQIHNHAAYIMRKQVKSCLECGYSLFVHVCHVRPVASFPPDALVSEINDPSNLVLLCPNHHTEFDAGLLRLRR
jgi:hypothetical protein